MKIPATAPPEIQQAFHEVWVALDRWNGAQNIDLGGRRIINANTGIDPMDYVTRYDVATMLADVREDVVSGASGLSGLVPGAVLFAKSATVAGQDASNFYWNDVLDCLGIGTRLPTSPLHIVTEAASGPRIDSYGSTALLKGYGSAGTKASPAATASGASFMGLWAYGHTGSAWMTSPSARLEMVAAETFSGSVSGSYLDIFLTKATTTTCAKMARLTGTGSLFVSKTTWANTKQTVGVTIDQGTETDEILAFKANGSVAHGMTTYWDTDTYGMIKRLTSGSGGVFLAGLDGSATSALQLLGVVGAEDATRSTSGVGPVLIDGAIKNGTSTAALAADKNLVAIRNNGSTKAIFDSDGDLHLDGTSNNNVWDAYDDVELLTAYRALTGPMNMRTRFGDVLAQHRDVLVRTGVMSANGFVSMKGLSALMIDAIRQLAAQQRSAA